MLMLEAYDPVSEKFVRAIQLPAVPMEELARIFRTVPEELPGGAWSINEAIAQELAVFLDEPLDIQNYDWFFTERSTGYR